MAGWPKTGRAFSRFLRNFFLWFLWTQMGTLLKALLEKTGIRWFFSGLPVELPACFLPNFRVVEIPDLRQKALAVRGGSRTAR